MQRQWRFSQHFLIRYLSFSSKFLIALARNCVKGWENVFRLIRFDWHNIFLSINWKNYFDPSILVISMTVLVGYGMGIAPSNQPSNHLFRPPFLVQCQARMELYGKDIIPPHLPPIHCRYSYSAVWCRKVINPSIPASYTRPSLLL